MQIFCNIHCCICSCNDYKKIISWVKLARKGDVGPRKLYAVFSSHYLSHMLTIFLSLLSSWKNAVLSIMVCYVQKVSMNHGNKSMLYHLLSLYHYLDEFQDHWLGCFLYRFIWLLNNSLRNSNVAEEAYNYDL
jgi:hypothetical protein